jgi:hypothetical protein
MYLSSEGTFYHLDLHPVMRTRCTLLALLSITLLSCGSSTEPTIPDYINGTWTYASRQIYSPLNGREPVDSVSGTLVLGSDGKWSRTLVQPEGTTIDHGTAYMRNSALYLERADGEYSERWQFIGSSVTGTPSGVTEGIRLGGDLEGGGRIYYVLERLAD